MNTDITVMIDQIIPFYFGPAEKSLFGLYYAPQPQMARETGILICNPWGQEYVRAHRAVSQLALRLARQGFATLRFDYSSSGDSAGEDQAANLGQWQSDIRLALQELKRRARVDEVFLAGLRLGASLAASVASGRDDIEGVLLWEPVVNGHEYLQELQTWHEDKLLFFQHESGRKQAAGEPTELVGFGVNQEFLADLKNLDLMNLPRRPASRVFITEREARPAVAKLCQHLERQGAQVEYALVDSFQMWTEDPDKGLVPQSVLQAALAWILQEAV